MKTPPLIAAIKRLRAFAVYNDAVDAPLDDPYRTRLTDQTVEDDVKLVLRALDLLDAEHIDDRDMEPVFEVKPSCLWTNAPKGLVHCLGVALVNEDLPDGGTFK